MRALRKLASWLFGGVFFVAGVLKLMDPVGTSLIVTEYFKFLKVPFLIPLSWWTGEALALCETVLGAAVVTGVWKKTAACLSAAFMLAFTALTFALWTANPEMDCGCFGEAVHLTHFQSFLKNIVLDLLWVVAFIPFSKLQPTPKIKRFSFPIACLLIAIFALGYATSIPPVDFTSMSPGSELYQPDDFLDDAPVLSFRNQDGEYADSLATRRRVMILSAYAPQKLSPSNWRRMADFKKRAEAQRYTVLLLASSLPDQLDSAFVDKAFIADRKTLMTLNRSNGGVTFISSGLIVDKWAARRTPSDSILEKLRTSDPTEAAMDADTLSGLSLQGFILIMLGIMILL